MKPTVVSHDYRQRFSKNAVDFDSIVSDLLKEYDRMLIGVIDLAKANPSGDIDTNPSGAEELLISTVGSDLAKKWLGLV